MHRHLFADDEAIGHKLTNRLAGVGIGDFINLVRVEPDFTFATSYHGSCKPFLSTKVNPEGKRGGLASLVRQGVKGTCWRSRSQ